MIEVVAAMVIFSSSAVILFSWIGQTSNRMAQFEAEQHRLFAELSALDYLRTVNPMQRPEGDADLQQSLHLSWRAQPAGEAEPVRISQSAPGIYQVQLFKVTFQLTGTGLQPFSQSVYLAGWKQTSEIKRELPFQLQ